MAPNPGGRKRGWKGQCSWERELNCPERQPSSLPDQSDFLQKYQSVYS
jgi:hypothetical protein